MHVHVCMCAVVSASVRACVRARVCVCVCMQARVCAITCMFQLLACAPSNLSSLLSKW